MSVTVEERNAEGICLSVTDAQAETLRRIRRNYRGVYFSAERWRDGRRDVLSEQGFLAVTLDAEGYVIRDIAGTWLRPGMDFDPDRAV